MASPTTEPLIYRLDDLERIANSPKPCRALDAILLRTINEGASAVEFDFQTGDFRVRHCVGGEWSEPPAPPLDFRGEIIKRLREIAGLESWGFQQALNAHVRLIAPGRDLESEVQFQTTDSGEVASVRLLLGQGT